MRYRIDLSYDGTNYHGWQIQPNATTVQGVLNEALHTILRAPILTMGSSRTDTGVHALIQVVHFDFNKELPGNLLYKLNNLLPWSIAINSIEKVDNEFHSRYGALSRAYLYRIHQEKNPFRHNKSFLFTKTLDMDQMNKACEILNKHTDFEAFSKVKTEVNNFNCTISQAYWKQENGQIIFYIKANRFLRNMVRSIVGTMIDVGLNKCSLDEFDQIIKTKKRSLAGVSAPACGLYLSEVNYE
ncbi:tRNA pseudouridine(38-40) synthase TruA [Cyclobacteriaceae bacterium]|nr:tRNA pseudouridine(38-40) synthase TruA [Cyclobacteriaceae bacterium]